jgi:hypothetical protein
LTPIVWMTFDMEFRVGGSASIFADDAALPKFEPKPKPVPDDGEWAAFQESQQQIWIRASEEDAAYELFYKHRWSVDQVKCSKPNLDRETLKRIRDMAKENRAFDEKYPFRKYSEHVYVHPMEALLD